MHPDVQQVLKEGQQHVTSVVHSLTNRSNTSTVGRAVDDKAREVVHEVARCCSGYDSAKKRFEQATHELEAQISQLTDLNAWLVTHGMQEHKYHDPRKK